MRTTFLPPCLASSLLALSVSAGCGDDANPSGGGTATGTGGSSGATDSASSTTTAGTTDSAGTDSNSGSSTSGGSSGSAGSSTTGVTEVLLYGEVRDYISDQPIADADISVFDDPNLSTTADGQGVYQLGPFTPNTDHFLVLPEDPDYWGAVIPVSIGMDAMQEQALSKISRDFVATQQMLLDPQMPAVHDPSTAFMLVRVLQNSAIMEGNVTITVDPPPAPGTFYAPDPDGNPILDSNEAQWGLLPVVVYFNVPPMAPGAYKITATHPVRECTVVYPDFPTIGGHMTLVDVDCPPAG